MQGHFLQFKIISNVFVMLNIHIKLTWLLNTKTDTGMILWTIVKWRYEQVKKSSFPKFARFVASNL